MQEICMARHRHKPSGAGVWLYGRHAVTAALGNPARRWRRLAVLAGREEEAATLVASARAVRRQGGAAIAVFDHNGFAAILPRHAVHQGLALEVEPLSEPDLDDVLEGIRSSAGRCIIVVLDQLSDPQNIGAVLRSAAAFGAIAVAVLASRAPPITGALAKAASGALESVSLIRVINLARAGSAEEGGFLDLRAPRDRAACVGRVRCRRAGRHRARLRGRRHAPPRTRAVRLPRTPADPPGTADAQRLQRRRDRALRA